ncbi:universal stress protein [Solirubrobacter ginsenosidimutans]|uniref:Universal stress protein n=1 Tax=Solirubrobacter ginsenosidimutans TaxID=490573 RepID=A0A9X3MVV5_9ACTN|nr:universal stress protein [Solirubrobacter ginsenosidimutans]MDA0162273.1 universal stress protein [Solirubrobacter ginsenosidimutans]
MNTIVIGVDATDRSFDVIAFARQFDHAHLIAATSFPVGGAPGYAILRDTALDTLHEATQGLSNVETRAIAETSPARALHDLAEATDADLIVVGSAHTGRLGRVLPGSTGEKLLHGTRCAVAVVPRGYTERRVTRIGVAYDGSDEARAALEAAAGLALSFGAQLELVGVAGLDWYAGPAIAGGVGYELDTLREETQQRLREQLDEASSTLTVEAETVLRTGDPVEELIKRTEQLDLLVTGSRGYGPLRAVLVGGVSGRVTRGAHCPVIVVPRGAARAAAEQAAA